MSGKVFSKEYKDEVIGKIKSEGMTGAEAGRLYGINPKNIYRWLAEGTNGSDSRVLEVNRLKREIRDLKQIIGNLILTVERGKKD